MHGALGQVLTGGVPSTVQPPTPAAPAATDDEAFIRVKDLPALANERMRPVYEANAQTAYHIVSQQYAKEFAKYGPEILVNINRIPVEQRSVDNLRAAVKFTLADHLDDLVRDRMHEASPEMLTLRSTGAAPASVQPTNDLSLKSDKMPADYRARLERVGMTEAVLDEYCRANSMTREQFFQQFEPKAIITEAPRR